MDVASWEGVNRGPGEEEVELVHRAGERAAVGVGVVRVLGVGVVVYPQWEVFRRGLSGRGGSGYEKRGAEGFRRSAEHRRS